MGGWKDKLVSGQMENWIDRLVDGEVGECGRTDG